MPISYKDIKTERLWKSSTGLSKAQFLELAILFKEQYESFFNETLEEKIAQSTSNVRFKTYEDLVFFGLYSLKSNLIPIAIGNDLLGLSFGLSASNAYENQSVFLAIMEGTLSANNYLPPKGFKNEKAFKDYLSSHSKLLIDVTEQCIQRSVNQKT